MTDEERQKLCEHLRYEARRGSPYTREAADEIERLATQVITWQAVCDVERKRAEKAESRINELLEFCEILRRERDEARKPNVR